MMHGLRLRTYMLSQVGGSWRHCEDDPARGHIGRCERILVVIVRSSVSHIRSIQYATIFVMDSEVFKADTST
jgi:hypothetical protein